MAQWNNPSCSEIQAYEIHGRDQTQCMEDMSQSDISSSSSLKGKEIPIEEVYDRGQTHYSSSASSWLIQIKKKLDSPDKMWLVSVKVCIYRVPKFIMSSNSDACVPFIISFGPYHHKINSQLSRIDEHKIEAVRRMSLRLQIDINTLIEEVKKLECEIRECYEEPIDLDGEALSWILTMDACFILEFFRGERDRVHFSLIFENFGKDNSTLQAILDDFIKLENQIPLFILIKFLQLEFVSREQAIKKLAERLGTRNTFHGHPFQVPWDDDDGISKLEKHTRKKRPPRHLLDLYRMVITDLLTNSSVNSATDPLDRDANGSGNNINNYHGWCGQLIDVPLTALKQRLRCIDSCGAAQNTISWHRWCGWWTSVRLLGWMRRLSCNNLLLHLCRTRSDDDPRSTPSAELLHKAGIKFKPGELKFEKKRFRPSTLFLHQIVVDDRTERLLRNLLAYEECRLCSRPPENNIISHFVRILDDLIDSEKDVSLLRKSGVIQSWVGSDEETARMFNRLSDGITFGIVEEFDTVMKEARDHYRSRWQVWVSEFKQQHCSKPWYVVSLVAAILILGMTAVQTVFSVKK